MKTRSLRSMWGNKSRDLLRASDFGTLNHTALYFGAEPSVVVDPAFHAEEDIQGEQEE